MLYKNLIRPTLFALSRGDAEMAHHYGLTVLKIIGLWGLRQVVAAFTVVQNPREVFGITFRNPVGLAAGFDKRAEALYGIEALGFGFIEVGTVTSLPQSGNPRPRMFRLSEDEALINRMGFNNGGKEALAKKLAQYKSLKIPLGINIGKGKDTSVENTIADYEAIIPVVYPYADYLVVNVSSPNTKDIRRFQEKEKLEQLLLAVSTSTHACAKEEKVKPVLLKIAPDLSREEVDDILAAARGRIDGFIVHNTSVARPESLHSSHKTETGGLSGKPLRENALGMVSYIHAQAPELPIIGVGGIFTGEDAAKMLSAGASLVQVYTGFVYEGPLLPLHINRTLLNQNGSRKTHN